MGLLRQAVKTVLEGILPDEVFLTRGRTRFGSSSPAKAISLTFDDGPHPEHTPRVLDALAKLNATATFFVIGERAEQQRSLTRRIVDEGHELANHTWTHSEPSRTSPEQFLQEIRRTREFIEGLTGEACWLMRPPKGELSPSKMRGLIRERQTIVLWNRDSKDYRMRNASELADWLNTYQPHHGDIVLMHDAFPAAAGGLNEFAGVWKEPEIEFCGVSEWLERRQAGRTEERSDDVPASRFS